MNLYTIVTNDAYEFPVKCDLRVGEVAKFLNVAKSTVRHMVFKPRKKSKYKVIVSGKTKYNAKEAQKRYRMTHDRSKQQRQWYMKRKGGMENE